jgi:hypothetical protein
MKVTAVCFLCGDRFIKKKFLIEHLKKHSKKEMIKALSKYQSIEGSGFP